MGIHLLGCLPSGSWCVHWCLEPGPASPLEGCVELSQLRDTKLKGGCDCPLLPPEWLWQNKGDLFLKGLFAKSYNISQVFNPGVTTSKTAHFSEQVHDVPVTAWPFWSLLYTCCSAQSVPYWKLKWQTGWGRSSLYLVRSVDPTMHTCQ